MQEALIVMSAKRFGVLGLVDDKQHLIGVITDGDLRRHMAPDLMSKLAHEIMHLNPHTITPNILAEEALAMMKDLKVTNFFVTQNTVNARFPIGILHIHDCLRIGLR